MSDQLQQISESAASIIRKDLESVREHLLKAQELTDGIRNVPMVVNGTKEGLKSLSAKIGEADEMMPKIFSLVNKTYGDPAEDKGTSSFSTIRKMEQPGDEAA